MNLYNPIEYLADESGHVTTMRLQHMRLGEPDEGGAADRYRSRETS